MPDQKKTTQKRKTHKYSEIEGDEIEEADINKVLGKTTVKSK